MRKSIVVCAAVLALSAGVGEAGVLIQPPPLPVRVGNVDAVFVGRVTEIEPTDVEAKSLPTAKENTTYRVAVVKINQAISGLKDEKTVRVAFIATMPGKVIRPIGRNSPKLEVGQEGLFMITSHHEEKFYLAPAYGYFISGQQKTYEDDVKTATKAAAVLKDVPTALASKDGDERLMAAAMQISKYRTQKPPFPNREEPIDEKESKSIMKALAEAKWAGPFAQGQIDPQRLFFQLGVHPEDGWKPPQKANADDMRQAIQAWVQANAGSYRIKRYVPGEKSKQP